MDGPKLVPYRPGDASSGPTRGGILDGLDQAPRGSGLELFMSPEEIAGIDDLVYRPGERASQDSEPRPLDARDNNLSGGTGDKSSGQTPHGNGIVEGDNEGLPQNPLDKASADHGSVAGKIWNLPNSAIGAAYGGLGYLGAGPASGLVCKRTRRA